MGGVLSFDNVGEVFVVWLLWVIHVVPAGPYYGMSVYLSVLWPSVCEEMFVWKYLCLVCREGTNRTNLSDCDDQQNQLVWLAELVVELFVSDWLSRVNLSCCFCSQWTVTVLSQHLHWCGRRGMRAWLEPLGMKVLLELHSLQSWCMDVMDGISLQLRESIISIIGIAMCNGERIPLCNGVILNPQRWNQNQD